MVIILIYNKVSFCCGHLLQTSASKALSILLNNKKEIMRNEEHLQDLWFLYF